MSVEVVKQIQDLKEGNITSVFKINNKKLFLIICEISGGELNTIRKEYWSIKDVSKLNNI